jgi:hypothetical protein
MLIWYSYFAVNLSSSVRSHVREKLTQLTPAVVAAAKQRMKNVDEDNLLLRSIISVFDEATAEVLHLMTQVTLFADSLQCIDSPDFDAGHVYGSRCNRIHLVDFVAVQHISSCCL